LDESEYWVSLEYRVSGELARMPENRFRFLWCDGFTPMHYVLGGPTPRITGRAWICNGPLQDEWDFALLLHRPVGSRNEIHWASLLPPVNVARWLGVDLNGRRIDIEPSAAVLDPAQGTSAGAPP
jgi:hypothetical protein